MTFFDDNELIAYKLQRYHKDRDGLEVDCLRLRADIVQALKAARVPFFDVTGRVKAPESFERKVRERPTREIQDVLGFRVITYVESDIPAAEAVLRDLFKVEDSSRVDKVATREPDSFGYRSLQFAAAEWPLGYDSDHDHWQNMADSPDKFEIQIRTILSHAWAAIDHKRYKDKQADGDETVRDDAGDRDFALTAALLEQADENLDRVARRGNSPVPAVLDERLDAVQFVETNRFSKKLDAKIIDALDLPSNHVILAERAVIGSVSVAAWKNNTEIERAVIRHGKLARRMAIACTDVTHSQIHTDYKGYEDVPPVAFEGIGVYWLGLAVAFGIGLPKDEQYRLRNHLGIPAGRIAEYSVIARYMIENPTESALAVREKYWKTRAPFGSEDAADFTPITLD